MLIGCTKSVPDEPPAPQADHIVLTDGESSRDFSAEGGTWQIDFDATADWTAEQVIPIAVQWYHFTPRLGKAGAGSVTVTVLPNTTDETRSAEIRLSAGRAEQILSITQQAGHVELTTENEVRAFLERLYRDTDGENWRFNANWCSDKPISEWDGVRYENGLLSLWLGEKYLKGQMDLSGCTALVELRCAKNSLTKIDVSGCPLLKEIDLLLPPPSEKDAMIGETADGEAVEVACVESDPMSAFVFKTVADPFVGKMSYIKVFSGKLTPNKEVVNATTGSTEKVGKLVTLQGKKQIDVAEAGCGDIVVAMKMNVNTNDTICDSTRVVKFAPMTFPKPCYKMAVRAKKQGDESKISAAMTRLMEEDLTIDYKLDPSTNEMILSTLGGLHLDSVVGRLAGTFGVEVETSVPKISYRETIRKKVKVQGRHKKQSGGHGQYGDVWIEFEPCVSDDLVFEEKVFGGAVPKNFFPAVEKGLQESVKKGVLAGFPVVGLKAILVDGSYHPVDSSEMAFKMAASIAYKEGMRQAEPVLLEPIGSLSVFVPDDNTGDMMGELNKRRGRVLGMNPAEKKGMTEIVAEVPMAEMADFTLLLRQMTQGQGVFTFEKARYEPLPANLVADVIAKNAVAD